MKSMSISTEATFVPGFRVHAVGQRSES